MKAYLLTTIIFIGISTATFAESVVSKHGLLRVQGGQVVNEKGQPVSLAGNSFFWSQWDRTGFWNEDCVKWLVEDWNTTIIRAAMGVENPGGYLEAPAKNEKKVRVLVDAAVAEGVYVIIDWHSHHAERSTSEAVAFFTRMARTYGKLDNVIYEIYNEPKETEWKEIKAYSETVIAAIRAVDPDNLIIVGCGKWSQRVDAPAADPITDWPNIAYTLHFYSKMHHQWLRDRADAALGKGIALFVTEWGPVGDGKNDPETEAWMKWCKKNKICHLAWAVNDKDEAWSIVKKGASPNGNWTTDDLRPAGKLERRIIRNWSDGNSSR